MPRSKKPAQSAADPAIPGSASASASTSAPVPNPNAAVPLADGKADPAPDGTAQTKIRGPVEEVLAKRLRQLGKKIQRLRTYAAAKQSNLNADQISAIASLPTLEAAYKELEDLIKPGGPVELAELGEAAKVRGLKEEAESAARALSESQAGSLLTTLPDPLAHFLQLHALLQPPRPSDIGTDSDAFTFSQLSLPASIEEEVQATDVLRVGRMWEDLLAGGNRGRGVLEVLIGKKRGDEEDEHILHLLHLLSQPAQSVSIPPTNPASVNGDADAAAGAEGDSGTQPEVQTVPPSEFGDRAGEAEKPSEVIQPESRGQSTPGDGPSANAIGGAGGGGMLNFLQADELQEEKGRIEEGYEIVQQPAAHEHYDIPDPAPPALAQPASTHQSNSFNAPPVSFNWADEEDTTPTTSSLVPPGIDRELSHPAHPAEGIAGGRTGSVSQQVEQTEDGPAIAQVQETDLMSGDADEVRAPTGVEGVEPAAEVPVPTLEGTSALPIESAAAAGTSQRGRGGPRRGRGGVRGGQPSGSHQAHGRQPSQTHSHVQASQQQQQAGSRGTVVDEDGFEMKVRPGAGRDRGSGGPEAGIGGRGAFRGGRGGRAGEGGEGGERGGRGRGRGGAMRGGPGFARSTSSSGANGAVGPNTAQGAAGSPQGQGQGQGQRGPRPGGGAGAGAPSGAGQGAAAKPKPSIYKSGGSTPMA